MKKMFLDNIGYVEYVFHSGDEKTISHIAGISHLSEKGPSIEKLLAWGHLSPFEFASITFKVKAPIFVARQWMRHRTGHYLEKSLRYCEANIDFYVPDFENDTIEYNYSQIIGNTFVDYYDLLREGVPKEIARGVLPTAIYTEFFFQMDLRNLLNFFKMRLDKSAQKEIQEYAKLMLDIVQNYFPIYTKYVRDMLEEKV